MAWFRALVLLALFVVNQVACTSWQVPKVTPKEYVAQHPDTKIRVFVLTEGRFLADSVPELGKKGQVLTNVRFSRDSVFGLDKKGQPVAYGLQQVAIEVRPPQGQSPWFFRAEGGRATIHRASSTGAAFGVRVGRALEDRRILRADLGVASSGADESYATIDLGLELRPLPGTFSPVVGVGAGVLTEPGFMGGVIRGHLALDARLGNAITLRVGGQIAEHGAKSGPNLLYAGLEFGGRLRR